MILACLQVTRKPTDQHHQLSITHIDQGTYAMADVRGPLDTKFCPVESMLGPWIRVGYGKRLNIDIPFNTFIAYSTKAASNFLVSEKGLKRRVNKSDILVVKGHGVRLRFNTY
jgi:hypothetical protein